ncbi:sensor histidine kinase [Dyella terrae]|uniref:sensor histidine kinase n=1 Tax=Dyella terrae TaxID=522259 RepID=UPI001EFEDCAC|nr:ATP-binding protein [Dyella terrae]ULU24582.1 HAMP domain-containing protein [Dyella terrae]
MTRLYLRIYLTVVASLLAYAAAFAWVWHSKGGPYETAMHSQAQVILNALPPAQAPALEQQRSLDKLAKGQPGRLALLDDSRRLIVESDGRPSIDDQHALPHSSESLWTLHLPDGRWLEASPPRDGHQPLHVLLLSLLTLAAIIGVLVLPVVRRITGRLERLQRAVESLGAGDLHARVAVEGRDEVARLAGSFNQAADRIEALVGHQKSLLANASHELRTPLTRIRLALELIGPAVDEGRRDGLKQDIGELDALIDEILLASRLEALPHLEAIEPVDLLALAAEECARHDGVDLEGTPVTVKGDPRLLLRLLRNLLDNATRHGLPPVQVRLRLTEGRAELVVRDHGPGLTEDESHRVFEPFYRGSAARDRAGTGLGLALARQIARHHGGELGCRYEPDGAFALVMSIPAEM